MFTYPVGTIGASVNNDFIITINTALGTGDSFQLPLPSGQTYNFVVNWGDGNSDTITAYNQAETLHNYSTGGIYQITIIGKCGGWSFKNLGDKLKITSVDQWGDVGFDFLLGGFNGCSNLAGIPDENINYSGTTLVQFFRNCSSLPAIYTATFEKCISVTSMDSVLFGCSSLTSLPTDVFRYNTLNTSFGSAMQNCIALASIPENIFYYNTLVTSYGFTFYFCRNIVLPSVIYNLSSLSIVVSFASHMYAGSTLYSNTGTIQDVWNYATSAISTNAFFNQTALTNYASIPNGWKGL